MRQTDEDLVLFATSIAMQLAKGLSAEEIGQLQCLLGQISCSLNTLVGCKRNKKSRKDLDLL